MKRPLRHVSRPGSPTARPQLISPGRSQPGGHRGGERRGGEGGAAGCPCGLRRPPPVCLCRCKLPPRPPSPPGHALRPRSLCDRQHPGPAGRSACFGGHVRPVASVVSGTSPPSPSVSLVGSSGERRTCVLRRGPIPPGRSQNPALMWMRSQEMIAIRLGDNYSGISTHCSD